MPTNLTVTAYGEMTDLDIPDFPGDRAADGRAIISLDGTYVAYDLYATKVAGVSLRTGDVLYAYPLDSLEYSNTYATWIEDPGSSIPPPPGLGLINWSTSIFRSIVQYPHYWTEDGSMGTMTNFWEFDGGEFLGGSESPGIDYSSRHHRTYNYSAWNGLTASMALIFPAFTLNQFEGDFLNGFIRRRKTSQDEGISEQLDGIGPEPRGWVYGGGFTFDYEGCAMDITPDGAIWYIARDDNSNIHRIDINGDYSSYGVDWNETLIAAMPNNTILLRDGGNVIELSSDGTKTDNDSAGAATITSYSVYNLRVSHDQNHTVYFVGSMAGWENFDQTDNYSAVGGSTHYSIIRVIADDIIPPLRRLQRNDSFNAPRTKVGPNQPTSIQESVRSGTMNTYL